MNRTSGFTLIELLIVVAIIGVLASLIIPRMTAQTEKANVMEAMTFLGMMRKGQIQFFNQNRRYVFIPDGFPCQGCDLTTNAQAETAWALLGMTPPDYSRSNSVWMYGANNESNPPAGEVRAIRVFPGTIVEKIDGSPQGVITLDPSGSWAASLGDYAPGSPLAPTK